MTTLFLVNKYKTSTNSAQLSRNYLQNNYAQLYTILKSHLKLTTQTTLYNILQHSTTLYNILHHSTQLYNTPHNSTHMYRNFTKLHTTIHNYTQLYKIALTNPQLFQNFTKLFKTIHNFTQLYNTLQHLTQVYNIIQHFKHQHNSTQFYNHLFNPRSRQNFTNLCATIHKLTTINKHTKLDTTLRNYTRLYKKKTIVNFSELELYQAFTNLTCFSIQ